MALDQPLGAIILYGREEERQDRAAIFRRSDRELLEHFGLVAGVLSELTELSGRSSDAERLLEESRQDRMRLQSVADLGETSVKLAKEMANPLASITGFARRVHRLIEEEDPNREYLEIIVREGERLERMVKEHLQFAGLQKPRLTMCSLNHILQTTVKKFEADLDPKTLRLLKKFSPQVPAMLLDEDRIRQAIENILISAMDGVPKGGRLLIQSRRTKDHAVVEVCHDGPPLSNDVLEQLFVPFGTGGRPGIGLGLGLAQRIVRDHGGEIGVQARGDWGHFLALSLPLQDNEDRRQRRDRRLSAGRDRRNRFPMG
jgi:two-component system sensor histidine kinase HydH